MRPDQVPQFTFFSCHAQEAQHASSWAELAPHFEKETSKSEDDVWWLDVCDGAEEDVAAVARLLSIHPLTVEDIALQEPRQKIETFPDYYLITQRTLSVSLDEVQEIEKPKISEDGPLLPIPGRPSPEMLFILVFGQGTVTFSRSGTGHVTRVRSRVAREHDRSVLSSDWICYALLYVCNTLSESLY